MTADPTRETAMPIRPENKALYPANWKEISHRVRFERAGGKCEKCGAPHGEVIARGSDGTYMLVDGHVFDAETGEVRGMAKGSEYPVQRFVKVVLTTAHLNHDLTDHRDEVLKAYCQLHHLRHDAKEHASTARRNRDKKRGQGILVLRED